MLCSITGCSLLGRTATPCPSLASGPHAGWSPCSGALEPPFLVDLCGPRPSSSLRPELWDLLFQGLLGGVCHSPVASVTASHVGEQPFQLNKPMFLCSSKHVHTRSFSTSQGGKLPSHLSSRKKQKLNQCRQFSSNSVPGHQHVASISGKAITGGCGFWLWKSRHPCARPGMRGLCPSHPGRAAPGSLQPKGALEPTLKGGGGQGCPAHVTIRTRVDAEV